MAADAVAVRDLRHQDVRERRQAAAPGVHDDELQHDLPKISALDLSLVLAGADHCSVLTARARVDPVADPRSDWFVRRLPAAVEDTLPG